MVDHLIQGKGQKHRVMPGGGDGAMIYAWTGGGDDLTPVPLVPGQLAILYWAGDGEDTGVGGAKPFITTVSGDTAVEEFGYLPLGSQFVGMTWLTGNGVYTINPAFGTRYIQVIVGTYGQALAA